MRLGKQLDQINKEIKNEQDRMAKIEKLRQRDLMLEKKKEELRGQIKKKSYSDQIKDQNTFLNTTSSLSRSNSKALAAIGKAASITQIALKTPEAVASSFAFGTRTGGPILGYTFAGIAAAAMAAQAAAVAGIPLAEGGIVTARPGGVPAVIGEGGQDEAVIPLDEGAPQMGTTVNLTVNGGMLGDEDSARQLAVAIDEELFKLRKGNESVAFDEEIA